MSANTDNGRMREFQSKNRQSQFAAFLIQFTYGFILNYPLRPAQKQLAKNKAALFVQG